MERKRERERERDVLMISLKHTPASHMYVLFKVCSNHTKFKLQSTRTPKGTL